MRKRRFNRIKQAIKNGATGGYLTKYLSYQSGSSPLTITKVVDRKGTIKKALNPFGDAATVPASLLVSFTGRAAAAQAGFGVTDAILALDDVDASTVKNRGFLPAKAVLTERSSGSAPKVSGITGLSYKKPTSSDSFTLPFGQVTGDGEFERQAVIVAAVTAASSPTNIKSVSFKPERMYS